MANTDFTLTSTEETRAGAVACMEALRAIESINNIPRDGSIEAWWRDKENAVAAMLQAAGNPTGFMAGFIAALAEYAKDSEPTLNLGKWIPEAAMTAEEKAASRTTFEEEITEIVKETTPTEEDKDLAYQDASTRAKKSIGELLTSPDDFKNRCASHVAAIVPVLVIEDDGYSFEDTTIEKINHSITSLREIIKGGEVAYTPSIYDRQYNEIITDAFGKHRHVWADEDEMNAYIQRFISESQAHKPELEPASI